MLKDSPKHLRETVELTVRFDADSREVSPPEKFVKALAQNREAKTIFQRLPPSRKLEMVKYLVRLKTEEALDKNIKRAINCLLGKERFIGRSEP